VAEPHPHSVEAALSFERFQILPRRRLLLEAGKPVRLGSRAFDVLLALLERPWPDIHVAEGNLKVQMAAVRRVLRDGQDGRRFIDTSPGQGYCFVAPVSVSRRRRNRHHRSPTRSGITFPSS
jgi:DNA-binding winged helix-turn-helix (wHTH) protein